LSEARTKPEPFFTILALADGHHAVKGNPRPPFLIVWHYDVVYDMPVGKVLHCPAEVSTIDTEHCGALANSGGKKKDFLIGHVPLKPIHQV
jgi:hypothetical protein